MEEDGKVRCGRCNGDGWEIGHSYNCNGWDTGDCDCGGEQQQCEQCRGEGYL